MEAAPYDRQEQRIAEYLSEVAGIGGPDPIGYLIASHAWVCAERQQMLKVIDAARKWLSDYRTGASPLRKALREYLEGEE